MSRTPGIRAHGDHGAGIRQVWWTHRLTQCGRHVSSWDSVLSSSKLHSRAGSLGRVGKLAAGRAKPKPLHLGVLGLGIQGRERRIYKRIDERMCRTESLLLCGRNYHHVVNQLYLKKKKSKKEREPFRPWSTLKLALLGSLAASEPVTCQRTEAPIASLGHMGRSVIPCCQDCIVLRRDDP